MNILAAKRLTIVTHERDSYDGRPLFESILELLAREGISSASVTRAVTGFSGSGPVHTANIEVLSFDLPVVIEATDVAEKIDRVVMNLEDICPASMVDVMPVQMIRGRTD